MELNGEAHPWLSRRFQGTEKSGGLRHHLIPLTLILSHPGEEALQNASPYLRTAALTSLGRPIRTTDVPFLGTDFTTRAAPATQSPSIRRPGHPE